MFWRDSRKFVPELKTGSSRETKPAQEVLKSWIGTQHIEGRPQKDGRVESLYIRFFQPCECSILFVETCIDERNICRSGRFVIRSTLQVIQDL